MPRISVIIPTHDRPHLLIRAIESATRRRADVEIIIVDDASTDGTAEACEKLTGIKYVRVEEIKVSRARATLASSRVARTT